MSDDAPAPRYTADQTRDIIAAKFDRLAQRLGVSPHPMPPDGEPTWITKFGTYGYDNFALIDALLDRLDELENKIRTIDPNA